MPWVEPNPDQVLLPIPGARPDKLAEPEPPGPWRTITAAAERSWTIYNLGRRFLEESNPAEPDYNPFEDERFKDNDFLHRHGDKLTNVYSRRDMDALVERVKREEEAERDVSAAGVPGALASMVFSLLDPTIAVPGTVLVRGAKGAYSFGRTVAATSAVTGAAVAAQEAVLQGTQETRTANESLLNVGSATLLSVILGGGAAALLSRGERKVFERALDQQRSQFAPVASGGAAAADIRIAELKTFLPQPLSRAWQRTKDAIDAIPVVGPAARKIAEFPEFVALKNNPQLRLQTSESVAARRAVGDLAESALVNKEAELGITPSRFGIPLDRDTRNTIDRAEIEIYEAFQREFSDYRFSGKVMLPGVRSFMEKKFGKTDALDQQKFLEEIDWALRNGGEHAIPQVERMAKIFRKWLDVVKELAKAQGRDIGDDVLGAKSFAPRLYDKIELDKQRPLFVQRYVDWRKSDQAKKAQQQQMMRLNWRTLVDARKVQRKLERQIETADARISETEARLSERGMEAKAAVGRSFDLAERDREARAAAQELKQFISELREADSTPEIKKQIAELERGIRELENKAKPVTEKDLDAIEDLERNSILTGPMRRAARVAIGKTKPPQPPSFWKWVKSKGGIKNIGGDFGEEAKGLVRADGMEWVDLQQLLADEFPELRARGWGKDGAKPADDFSEEIREALSESVGGQEPYWFLDAKWDSDDRFVYEVAAQLDRIASANGLEFKTIKDVADFFRDPGGQYGLSEADLDRMIAQTDAGPASIDAAAEVQFAGRLVETRRETLGLFKNTLEAAKRNLGSAKTRVARTTAGGKEASVATNRNLGRLGILNERAERAQELRDTLDRSLASAKQWELDALNRIETLIDEWDGRSASAAQGALKRRIAADAARTPEQKAKTPRLASADREVARAVRSILKSDRDMIDAELVAEAEKVIENSMGLPDGRLLDSEPGVVRGFDPLAEQGDVRGSLNRRRNPMPDEDLLPFLVRNPIAYTLNYLRQGLTDLGMIARFGDTEGQKALVEIKEDWARLMRAETDPKELARMGRQRDNDIRDFQIIRDRIKGTFGASADAYMRNAGRIAQGISKFNTSTSGGGFGLSQVVDFGGVIIRNGLTRTFRDGFAPFAAKLAGVSPGMKAASRDYRAMRIGAETYIAMRGMDQINLSDVYQHNSPLEKTLRGAAQSVVTLSGMTVVTDAQRIIAATVVGNNIFRMARRVSEGKAGPKEIADLAANNIDPQRAKDIWKAFNEGGGYVSDDGVYVPNLDSWADQASARFFESAVKREVHISILEPGQELPAMMSRPVFALLTQYKRFVASAMTRVLLANMQRRDANTLVGLLAYLGLGMMVSAGYKVAAGQELPGADQWADWVKDGSDRAGFLSWYGEMNAMAAKATGGKADIFRIIGAERPYSRYVSRGLVGNLLGPTFGKAENITQVVYGMSGGEWTEAETRKLRQLIAFQNLIYIRGLFDEVERNANQFFGIKMKAENR